jgi:tRNA (guanine-N7-)-methyltransferase
MVEAELGVPFPGTVLPPAQWTSTLWADEESPFSWARTFGRQAPHVVDVGCGTGRYLISSALTRADRDHLGIELVRPLLERTSHRADERGLTNVRFVAGDAVQWLFRRLDAASVDELHVYHPQPYYDPREAGLGMLTADFFGRAWEVVRPGGILVLQTDHRGYGRYLIQSVAKHFDPVVHGVPWPDAPLGRTRREIVARRKGLPILRVVARRRPTPIDLELPAPYFDLARPGLRRLRLRRNRRSGSEAGQGSGSK